MTDRTHLHAILLAAGPSSRLGQSKQLVEFEGESLVRRSARMLCELSPGRVVVVTGSDSERIAAKVEGLSLDVAFNPEWKLGMGGSIACGARFVPKFPGGILVMVCDQWQLGRDDLERLLDAWETAPSRIHVACWKEGAAHVSGPPVVFPGRLHGELKGLDKSRGARQIIDRYMDVVEFVELEKAAKDLDRPEDLEELQKFRDG